MRGGGTGYLDATGSATLAALRSLAAIHHSAGESGDATNRRRRLSSVVEGKLVQTARPGPDASTSGSVEHQKRKAIRRRRGSWEGDASLMLERVIGVPVLVVWRRYGVRCDEKRQPGRSNRSWTA